MLGIQRRISSTHTHTTRPYQQHAYTHYTPVSAARIDRIYISEDLSCNKQGAETIAAAFSDHLAVLIRIKFAIALLLQGKGR
jgi:endonuclease/exonuclease/phosphatase family metal-dependent hydrolase